MVIFEWCSFRGLFKCEIVSNTQNRSLNCNLSTFLEFNPNTHEQRWTLSLGRWLMRARFYPIQQYVTYHSPTWRTFGFALFDLCYMLRVHTSKMLVYFHIFHLLMYVFMQPHSALQCLHNEFYCIPCELRSFAAVCLPCILCISNEFTIVKAYIGNPFKDLTQLILIIIILHSPQKSHFRAFYVSVAFSQLKSLVSLWLFVFTTAKKHNHKLIENGGL